MNANEQQQHQIQLSMEQATAAIAASDALRRLEKNADFQTLIVEGYFEKEAARLIHLNFDPNINHPSQAHVKETISADMAGPAAFKRYLGGIHQMGEISRQALVDSEEELEALRAEELISDEE